MTIDVLWASVGIAGLGVITLLTRAFFMLPAREWPLPEWLRAGLRYAPLAALSAVVAPEIVMHQGAVLNTLVDARLPAAAIAGAYYMLRRGILGTIVAGMAVYLPLHIGLGW